MKASHMLLALVVLALAGCALPKRHYSGGDGSTEESAIIVPGGCEDYRWYIRSRYPSSSPIKFLWETSEISGALQHYKFTTHEGQLKQLWFRVPFECRRIKVYGAGPNNSFKPKPLRGSA